MTRKINEDFLDYDDDQCMLDDIPFTGIGFLEYPDNSLKSKSCYLNGYEHGLCQEWYSNHQLKIEWTAVHGRAKGKINQWYADGKIKSVGEYDYGVEIEYKEWNENGELLIHREVNKESEMYKYLIQMRESKKD